MVVEVDEKRWIWTMNEVAGKGLKIQKIDGGV